MPLSREEQRVLDAIENGFQVDDPVFAAKLNFTATRRHFRRQTVLAHGCLWLGMFMTLTGFGLVHDVLGAGVLLILYGLGLLVMATVAVVQLRSPVGGSPRRRSF
jgi:DUF3040 family protein